MAVGLEGDAERYLDFIVQQANSGDRQAVMRTDAGRLWRRTVTECAVEYAAALRRRHVPLPHKAKRRRGPLATVRYWHVSVRTVPADQDEHPGSWMAGRVAVLRDGSAHGLWSPSTGLMNGTAHSRGLELLADLGTDATCPPEMVRDDFARSLAQEIARGR